MVTQEDLNRSILNLNTRGTATATDYFTTGLMKHKIGVLRDNYVHKRGALAANMLRTQVELDIEDPDIIMPANSPNVRWLDGGSFIDLLVLVPRGLGLYAVLPKLLESRATYELALNFTNRLKSWRMSKAMLGCDPTGSTLWIGRANAMDVWLVMMPDDILARNESPTTVGGADAQGEPRLSTTAYQIMMFFFSYALGDAGNAEFDTLKYPKLDEWKTFANASPIL